MFIRPISATGAVAAVHEEPAKSYDLGSISLEKQVQCGLNLFLRLKSPAQMPALLKSIAAHQDAVNDALKSLHYVHFARFLPSMDGSTLMVITVFDGDPHRYDEGMRSYLMDFVAVLGEIFTAILMFVKDAPRLPVKQYPKDFLDFIQKNIIRPPIAQPWSAYPDMTVLDIVDPQSVR